MSDDRDVVVEALAREWDAAPFYPRCGRCWDAARRDSGIPPRWRYSDEEQARFAALALTVPDSTHLYAPSCKCSGGCADEYLCASCAASVEKPEFVELLDGVTQEPRERVGLEGA